MLFKWLWYSGDGVLGRALEVVVLRDVVGLSWRTIARMVYPREYRVDPDRTVLKIRGMYATYSRRYNVSCDSVITSDGVITVVSDSRPRLYDGDPRDLNISMSLGTESFRRSRRFLDQCGRHREELLQLLRIVYDRVGISSFDRERVFLMGLIGFGRKFLELVDLSRANADIKNDVVYSAHSEALAYVYVVFYVATYGTQYMHYMPRVWRFILDVLPRKRNREKKLREVREKIKEMLPKALDIILRDTPG